MNINELIYFETQNKHFSLNVGECLQILPIANIHIVCKDAIICNDDKITNFMLYNEEIIPLFDLSKALNAQEDITNSHIVIVYINNKKIGLEFLFNRICLQGKDLQKVYKINVHSLLGFAF